MKLFTKYSRLNLVSTIIIFLLGSLAFSFLIRNVVISQIDEDLRIEKNEIEVYSNRFNHLPNIIEVHDQYTIYNEISAPRSAVNRIFSHDVINKNSGEEELQRSIEFTLNVNNAWYLVQVSKSLEGADELIQTIIIITAAIILLVLAVTFFINRFFLKKLWQPFYNTLKVTQHFKLSDDDKIHFAENDVDEFTQLNSILQTSLSKAQHDYHSLKEFTENASHELQTPLAVIQSKLDILIQSEKFSETESKAIESAYASIQNLKRLNQSLLLLTKIENNQFTNKTTIDFSDLLQKKISQFEDIWRAKNITFEVDIKPARLYNNQMLMDILLNNLLSNATKHNIPKGDINIELDANKLIITNTGISLGIDNKILFKRFSKVNSGGDSYGLGLSIIQQICIASGLSCAYSFQNSCTHKFEINFAASEQQVFTK